MFSQNEADRLVHAASVALSDGDLERAAGLLDAAVGADARHPMALAKQAELAMWRKDHRRALGLSEAAIAIEANCAPAWYQRSAACWAAGRQAEAVEAVRRAVEIQPPNPDFRLRLAQFAAWTGDGAGAMAGLQPLLSAEEHDPVHYAAAVSMVGELAIAEGRFDEANQYLDRALALQPGLTVTRMQRGMNLLRLGDFPAGWADYGVRESIRDLMVDGQATMAEHPWRGEDLSGKTIVVVDDQGHGDAIQFFRTVPLLRGRGAQHIRWRTFPALVRLFREAVTGRLGRYVSVVDTLAGGARFDFQCTSTSLPRWLGITLDSIPAAVPYLRPPQDPPSAMLLPIGRVPTGRRLRVGLVWSGDARHTRDHLRSIPAGLFLRLTDVAGVSFHSLQHEIRAGDRVAVGVCGRLSREVEKAADLADTAALIARLDLVITVDTAVAHLAGALGKPVWIVLHVAADWRWLTERADSPWYPTVRLFRVTPAEWLERCRGGAAGGWEPVLERVSAALRALVGG